MAGSTDPRALAFNAVEFRDAIRFAMVMGLPEATEERITFVWTKDKTFAVADPKGNPYSWSDEPTRVISHPDVQVAAAVQFQPRVSGGVAGTAFGDIETPRIIVTLLDEEYAEVEGSDKIVLDGNTYNIDFVKPPDGLFVVTVYTLYATAEDES